MKGRGTTLVVPKRPNGSRGFSPEGHYEPQTLHNSDRAAVAGPPTHRVALRAILERTPRCRRDALRRQRPAQRMDVAHDRSLLRAWRDRLRPGHLHSDRPRDPATE